MRGPRRARRIGTVHLLRHCGETLRILIPDPDPLRQSSRKARELKPCRRASKHSKRNSAPRRKPPRRSSTLNRQHIRAVLARVEAIGPELEAALARWMALEDRR